MTVLAIEHRSQEYPPGCMATLAMPWDHSTKLVRRYIIRECCAFETITACSADFTIYRTRDLHYVAFAGAPYGGIALRDPFVTEQDAVDAAMDFLMSNPS